jgi:hypothetical protein
MNQYINQPIAVFLEWDECSRIIQCGITRSVCQPLEFGELLVLLYSLVLLLPALTFVDQYLSSIPYTFSATV